MALAPGGRLGPSEIVSALGAGGMGEVYEARDTRLDRTVAIKVLPSQLADDQQFRERFDREARAVAALNHPHICALYDIGSQDATDFLVMEYLDGETLADRLGKGALPLDQALLYAIQIADALDKAHRAGIIHRDLKPGNVMLTKQGAKLLDFGLAKTSAPAVTTSGLSMLPTTPPAAITAQGTILGTFQYMAPEQIEGLEADARTDIFAFGVVLYEMVTGRKAFEGKTRASLLGAILKDEPPPISQIQPIAPASLNRIVATCLAKDPDDRWQSARDLLRELKWVADGTPVDASAVRARTQPGRWRRALPWALAGALGVGLAIVLGLWAPWRVAPPRAPQRLNAELGADVSLVVSQGAAAILSPDGQMLAFVGRKDTVGARPQLYVRRLEQLQATPLSGAESAIDPFFSPDGQWIAFFADGKLKKVSVTGGAAVTLCDAPSSRGGFWTEDGTIVFQPVNGPSAILMRVSSAGGKPEPQATLGQGEISQRWPQVLPGGKALLYTGSASLGNYDSADIVVQPLPTGSRKVVQRGGYYGRYLPSGHLVYIHEGTLFAAPFDLDRLEMIGQPVPALEGVTSASSTGGSQFAVSNNGTLVYLPGQSASNDAPISWMDRSGKATPLRATPANWSNPAIAPDGRRLAVDISDGRQVDVWVYEWTRDTLSRLTFDATDDQRPMWSPDGRRIVFASKRGDKATFNLYWQRADGTGEVQRLTDSKNNQLATSGIRAGNFSRSWKQPRRTAWI